MIRLDQIKLLESKVGKAIEQIRLLREENRALKRTVEKSQARTQELEVLAARYKSDQEEIEQGILRALKNLDRLEDEVGAKVNRKEPAAAPAPAAAHAPPTIATPTPAPQAPQPKPVAPAPPQPEPPDEPVVDDVEEDGEEPEGGSQEELGIF